MASRWFYRVDDQEAGPVTFAEMVEMARAGTLVENHRVRRETSAEWMPAWRVVGLFKIAQDRGQSAAKQEAPAPEPTRELPPAAGENKVESTAEKDVKDLIAAEPRQPKRITLRKCLSIGILALALVTTGLLYWNLRRSLSRPRVDLEAMRALVQAFQVFHVEAGEYAPVKLVPEPVLRFQNVPQPGWEGTVWAWGEIGRPVVVLKLYRADPEWNMSATLLADGQVLMKGRTGWRWQPRGLGIEFRPFAQAKSPSSEAPVRLQQMKEFATHFVAYQIWDPNNRRSVLRLATEPMHRYCDAHCNLLDGGLFILKAGPNPSPVILVEAVKKEAGSAYWQYGIARMGSAEFHVSLDGHEVWKCGRVGVTRPSDAYILVGEPMSR